MFTIRTRGPYHCVHCAYSQNSSVCRFYGGHKKTGSLNVPPLLNTNEDHAGNDDATSQTKIISDFIATSSARSAYMNSHHNTGASILYRRAFISDHQHRINEATKPLAGNKPRLAGDESLPFSGSRCQPIAGLDQVKHLRLTQCLKCNQLVDDYIQLDNCILFLDAVLQKTSFYRHIILNCSINPNVSWRILILLSLCDAYRRWTVTFNQSPSLPSNYCPSPTQDDGSSLLTLLTNWDFGSLINQSNGTIDCVKAECCTNDQVVQSEHESYLELEFSFYLSFVATLMSNMTFFLILYSIMWLAQHSQIVTLNRRQFSISSFLPDLITCSYGKLFSLPAILWGDELRPVIDVLIQLFIFISIVQCCYVYTKHASRLKAVAIVLPSFVAHYCVCLMGVKFSTYLIAEFVPYVMLLP